MAVKKVLIIEDDIEVIKLLELHLKDLDYQIISANDGKTGLELALKEKPDLIILDITLPIMDGVEICKKIRAKQCTPIIMLSARIEEIDRVLGLELGADDYITKPFSIREFIARVKAIFRRIEFNKENQEKSKIEIKGLVIDVHKRKVTINNTNINLSPKEFDLLTLMASNPGVNYSREHLLRTIWGYNYTGYEHTVNSHINRLRIKIEPDVANPTYIITRWGVGYAFNEDLI